MGKKHKKHHRSERKDYGGFGEDGEKPERPSEPPLRLVLKVGKGSETILTASPSSDHFSTADSPTTPEPEYKHSHYKKKKKKKKVDHERKRPSAHLNSSQTVTPEPETKASVDEREEVEGGSEEETEEGVWSEPPAAKKLVSLHERRANPSRHCKEAISVQEKRPLSKVLENLQKTLQRKDVDGFFTWPVNDIIAPGYSSIILRPMDFSTMKKKIEREEYDSIDEYKDNFVLMCENAMKYNRPETVYYKAAKKLLGTGQKVMSKERLATIKRAFGCVEELEGRVRERAQSKHFHKQHADKENMVLGERPDCDTSTMDTLTTDDGSVIMDQTDATGKSDNEDDMDEDDAKVLIQEVLEAAKTAKDRLTARQPNSKIGFLRKDKAGTTTLSLLNPTRENSEESLKVNLGMLTGRLTNGTASLQGFKEDKRNKALPVNYLMYGPFSSYAPECDSTFSNLSKEESDLIYSTYGDEEGVKYAKSIQEFVKESGDYVNQMVDTLLDSLTNGEHSRTKEQIRQNRSMDVQLELDDAAKDTVKQTDYAAVQEASAFKFDIDVLKSLSDEGIDMSFLPDLEKEINAHERLQSETEKEVDQQLGKTAELIRDLERSQNERLSRKPPSHLQYIPDPSDQEHAIAEQLTQQLKELTAKTLPAHLTSTEAIRRAMGVTMEPLADSLPSPSASHRAPSETTESSALPDDNALPDDIAKELEAEDVAAAGDEIGKGEEDDDEVDADIREELLELLKDKHESSQVTENSA